jgi:hypothetical protein
METRARHRWRLGIQLGALLGAVACVAQLVAGPSHAVGAPRTALHRTPAAAHASTVEVRRLPPTRLIARATLARPPAHPHESSADFPDPFVLRTRWNYIAYATNNRDGNVPMRRSPDLRQWSPAGDALPALPGWANAGGTWAPAVLPVGTGYVMYVTLHTRVGHECIATATATNPLGPFRLDPDMRRACIIWDAIDASPFVDTDGSHWLLFKVDVGRWRIDAQPLSADGRRLRGTPTTILTPTLAWEGANVEGPSLARRDGRLILLFSANNYRDASYRIGVATCATPAGPCQPDAQPFMETGNGIVGPGGAEWVRDGAGATSDVAYAAWRADDEGNAGPVRALRVIGTQVRRP